MRMGGGVLWNCDTPKAEMVNDVLRMRRHHGEPMHIAIARWNLAMAARGRWPNLTILKCHRDDQPVTAPTLFLPQIVTHRPEHRASPGKLHLPPGGLCARRVGSSPGTLSVS